MGIFQAPLWTTIGPLSVRSKKEPASVRKHFHFLCCQTQVFERDRTRLGFIIPLLAGVLIRLR